MTARDHCTRTKRFDDEWFETTYQYFMQACRDLPVSGDSRYVLGIAEHSKASFREYARQYTGSGLCGEDLSDDEYEDFMKDVDDFHRLGARLLRIGDLAYERFNGEEQARADRAFGFWESLAEVAGLEVDECL